ncbi:uncharacterized protein LOC114254592 [Monomorium pharaonis]|uniref:uncharacterized protein LOC114254592 n=1 Tax=Monomorium pharaonis TaxID=307658 RepID=UPI0017474B7A|nr:uncharacterized protein LOC114254592 [Monomorium pharaonis]
MSTRWLTIFLLLANFILIDSNGLPMINVDVEDKWISTDAGNVNCPNGGSDSLPSFNDSEASIQTQKCSTLLNQQRTKSHRHKEDEKVSSEKRNYLIATLSKIAKVRSFEEDPVSIKRTLMYDAVRDKSAYAQNGISAKNMGTLTPLDAKISSELLSNGILSVNPLSNKIGRKNCRAIRDVYVPEIKENVPSYACTSEGKTFILSSKRFLQDRRDNLRVSIDDDTLRKLNDPAVALTNGRFNIIPAILILKPGHDNYDIHTTKDHLTRAIDISNEICSRLREKKIRRYNLSASHVK